MPTPLFRTSLVLVLGLGLTVAHSPAQVQDCSGCHRDLKPEQLQRLLKSQSAAERGLGLMDKGQVSNYLGNYGVLSSYHEYFNNSAHWPNGANASTQYSFGLGLIAATKGNVITSVIGGPTDKTDWSPKVGSRGRIYSGDVKAPPPDETPFLASSDNPETWPLGYFDASGNWVGTPGKRHWPGHFRIDIDQGSATYGREVPGEFVSDRDIFCVFDDESNSNPQGKVGFEVEQSAYTYGRPYAEDMLFWNFAVMNKSGRQLDSVYVGYYAIFRVDYDNKDLLNIVDGSPNDGHTNGDFVYVWDSNNTKDGAWAGDLTPLGIIGLNVLETPKNLGITDFHYFNREVAPKVDEEMWPVISSNPNDANLRNVPSFFHGSNRRMDTTHPDSLKKYYTDGANINYFIMTGPFVMAPGETVKTSVALIMGNSGTIPNQADTVDLMKNLRITQQMYQRKFQGSGAPATPKVTATARDKSVRLAWDAEAERSKDVLTGLPNFEGYKIYRSDDLGRTWGTPLTDSYGNVVGYKPLKIFDLIDGIKGIDPAFNQSLGDETGIKHTYVDENLINGVEYWYCVASYSKGKQTGAIEQSYQSSLGQSTMQPNTVSVIPGIKSENYVPPAFSPQPGSGGSIPPIGGICNGVVTVDIISPELITGDDYIVSFVDSAGFAIAFNLQRVSKSTHDTTLVLDRQPFTDASGDNLSIVDGFRLTVKNAPFGVASLTWTKVSGDTCTFDWRAKPAAAYANRPAGQVVQEAVYTLDDYRITVDTNSTGGLWAKWYDYFSDTFQPTLQHLPLKVEVVSDPANPIDVSNYTILNEFAVLASWDEYRQYYYSQLGWDVAPGGLGYTAASPGFYELYTDFLNLERPVVDAITQDTTYTGLVLFTNNFPTTYVNANGDTVTRTAVAPSQGDQFTIITNKPFRKDVHYTFSTAASSFDAIASSDLQKIRVVPDPYIVANAWETNQFGKKLMFNHLPNECTISIYTVAGDFIATIDHIGSQGFEFWDMRTYNDQYISYGLYLFVVKTPTGQTRVGKFLVIK